MCVSLNMELCVKEKGWVRVCVGNQGTSILMNSPSAQTVDPFCHFP